MKRRAEERKKLKAFQDQRIERKVKNRASFLGSDIRVKGHLTHNS